MSNNKLLELAREAGKSVKSEADFAELRQQLMKATIEAALGAELDDHLDSAESSEPNSRNGYSSKQLQTEDGEFEPKLVKKHQRRFTALTV